MHTARCRHRTGRSGVILHHVHPERVAAAGAPRDVAGTPGTPPSARRLPLVAEPGAVFKRRDD